MIEAAGGNLLPVLGINEAKVKFGMYLIIWFLWLTTDDVLLGLYLMKQLICIEEWNVNLKSCLL